jgi:prolipoprotein diacylglyceryltransferase
MLPREVSFVFFSLNLYTFLIAFAILGWLFWNGRRGILLAVLLNITLVFGFVSLIFGRALYVALHWNYFQENTREIISLAGLSEHGALVGFFIGFWVFGKRERRILNLKAIKYDPIADAQLLIPLVGIAASLGCIPNGCAYGREVFWTDGLWWLLRADLPDAYGISNPRLPTQLFMAGWLLFVTSAIFFASLRGRSELKVQSSQPLSTFNLLLFTVLTGDFLIQFARADETIWLGNLRIEQVFDLAILCAALVWAIYSSRQKNHASISNRV